MDWAIEIRDLQKQGTGPAGLNITELLLPAGTALALTDIEPDQVELMLGLLFGEQQPGLGLIRIFGQDPIKQSPVATGTLGYMPAELPCYTQMSVQANLQFQADLFSIGRERIEELLAQVGLQDRAATPAGDLNLSQQKRLALAIALLTGPKLLIVVDPLAQIDQESRLLISSSLAEFVANGGALLALVGNEALATQYATHMGQIVDGRIKQSVIEVGEPTLPYRVTGRDNGTLVLLKPAEILYITIEQRQTWLQTGTQRIRSHASLSELAEKLTAHGFFRSHRAYLVNLQHIAGIVAFTRDSYGIILDNDERQQIPLSKQAYRDLRQHLEL